LKNKEGLHIMKIQQYQEGGAGQLKSLLMLNVNNRVKLQHHTVSLRSLVATLLCFSKLGVSSSSQPYIDDIYKGK
jgi:hypothetical protein